MLAVLLLLERRSKMPLLAIELAPLLTVEPALLIDDAPLNCRRLFADVPRITPDKVSISFRLGHGLEYKKRIVSYRISMNCINIKGSLTFLY